MNKQREIIYKFFSKKKKPELLEFSISLGSTCVGIKSEIINELIFHLVRCENLENLTISIPVKILEAVDILKSINYSCCNEEGMTRNTVICKNCNKYQHVSCVQEKATQDPYLCPNCILISLNPFEIVSKILVGAIKFEKIVHRENLVEVTEIGFSAYGIRNTICEAKGRKQVQVRCIEMTEKKKKNVWPELGCLMINGQVAMKFEKNRNLNQIKALNITQLVQEQNTLTLVVENDKKCYFLSVFIVEIIEFEILLKNLKESSFCTVEKGKTFIKEGFCNSDPNLNIHLEYSKLTCPLSKTLIRIPVKDKNCKHFKCFDLHSFYNLYTKAFQNPFVCPICKNQINNLVYDFYFEEILSNVHPGVSDPIVQFLPDGSYFFIDEDKLPKKRSNGPSLCPSEDNETGNNFIIIND